MKYKVTITETRHYYFDEIEADSIEEAGDIVFTSDKFVNDLCDDTDALVTEIVEVE